MCIRDSYPLAKLRRSAEAFRTFLGIQVLNSLASGALGLLVGAVAPSTDAALALFPPLIVLMIIFNGSNISDESTPKPIKFLPKLSLVRWGFEGLAVNEFDGLYFECQNRREDLRTGRDALARLAFEDSTVKKACVAQAAILGRLAAVGRRLRLPPSAVATASVYLRRFYAARPRALWRVDPLLGTAACLYLCLLYTSPSPRD